MNCCFSTVEEPDGELHLRHSKRFCRGHVLQETSGAQ